MAETNRLNLALFLGFSLSVVKLRPKYRQYSCIVLFSSLAPLSASPSRKALRAVVVPAGPVVLLPLAESDVEHLTAKETQSV